MSISAEQAAKLLEGATPGPWKLRKAYLDDDAVEIVPRKVRGKASPEVGSWAELATVQIEYTDSEMKANANLIAAAPDLARALIASETARKLAEERLAALIRRAHDAIIRDEKDGAVWAQLLADMAKEIDNG